MSVRRWPGTPTNPMEGAMWWTEVVNEKGWRIQFNKTFDTVTPLKPYRLLDPRGYIWASADDPDELQKELPELTEWIASKEPLFTGEDVKDAIKALGPLLIAIISKGKIKSKGNR